MQTAALFSHITPEAVIAALAGVAVLLLAWVIRLEWKLRKILIGKNAENIGDSISSLKSALDELEGFRSDVEEYLLTVESRLKKSIQGVATVRFNPFKGAGGGGNQSFATALVSEEGDGIIISSLYARDRVSVFGKPVKKRVPEFELSVEEEEAFSRASDIARQKKTRAR